MTTRNRRHEQFQFKVSHFKFENSLFLLCSPSRTLDEKERARAQQLVAAAKRVRLVCEWSCVCTKVGGGLEDGHLDVPLLSPQATLTSGHRIQNPEKLFTKIVCVKFLCGIHRYRQKILVKRRRDRQQGPKRLMRGIEKINTSPQQAMKLSPWKECSDGMKTPSRKYLSNSIAVWCQTRQPVSKKETLRAGRSLGKMEWVSMDGHPLNLSRINIL